MPAGDGERARGPGLSARGGLRLGAGQVAAGPRPRLARTAAAATTTTTTKAEVVALLMYAAKIVDWERGEWEAIALVATKTAVGAAAMIADGKVGGWAAAIALAAAAAAAAAAAVMAVAAVTAAGRC